MTREEIEGREKRADEVKDGIGEKRGNDLNGVSEWSIGLRRVELHKLIS